MINPLPISVAMMELITKEQLVLTMIVSFVPMAMAGAVLHVRIITPAIRQQHLNMIATMA